MCGNVTEPSVPFRYAPLVNDWIPERMNQSRTVSKKKQKRRSQTSASEHDRRWRSTHTLDNTKQKPHHYVVIMPYHAIHELKT